MENDEVTTVAADFMYLVVLSDEKTIKRIARVMNREASKKADNKLYIYTDTDTQVDYLPESKTLRSILKKGIDKKRSDILKSKHKFEIKSARDDEDSDINEECDNNNNNNNHIDNLDNLDNHDTDTSTESVNNKRYFVMGEGVETAQCYTCGEDYPESYMILEIEDNTEYCKISYPILNLDKEVNPEDLITSWIIDNKISHIVDSLNIRLVNMVGTEHDILVFTAYINGE